MARFAAYVALIWYAGGLWLCWQDFSKSWSNGLAFAALLHKIYPDCIDFASLSDDDPATTLDTAFHVAEDVFDIPWMLDVEDITSVKKPDEKIVLTYVSFFFKQFATYKKEKANVSAIKKACDITVRHDEWIEQYRAGSTQLKEWIQQTTEYVYVEEETHFPSLPFSLPLHSGLS